MTYEEMNTSIRQKIQDISGDLYTDAEVLVATNEAKNEVFDMMVINSAITNQASTSLAFTASDSSKDLPSDFESILEIRSGTGNVYTHDVVDFRHVHTGKWPTDFAVTRATDGTWSLIRNAVLTDAITVTVTYQAAPPDATASTSTFTFTTSSGLTLIVLMAAENLLRSRRRTESADGFVPRINRLRSDLVAKWKMVNKATPRYVRTPYAR